jgi:hypothetical protein
MVQKQSSPDALFPDWTAYNSRQTQGTDPGKLNTIADRLATGNRRLACPLTIGRGRDETYDNTLWDITIQVPPYTYGIGLIARLVCEVDDSNPGDEVHMYYRMSGEAWDRFLTFTQTSHGSTVSQEYVKVQFKSFLKTDPTANPNSTDWDNTPIPVDVSDEPQSITLQLKIDTSLDFNLFEYGFFMIPYYNEFPDLP